MTNIHKRNIKETLTWMMSLTTFILMGPYFVWPTFMGVFSSLIPKGSLFVTVLFVLFYFIIINKKMNKTDCIIGAFFITLWMYILMTSILNTIYLGMGNYFLLILVLGFLFLTDYDKKVAFNKLSLIFAISLVPAIIILIISYLGFEFPYQILLPHHTGKMLTGHYYKNYIGAVILQPSYLRYTRICGMFDEPGVVGTFAALFLVGDNLRLKGKVKNIIIMIGGVLSGSLAFFILLFVAYVLKILGEGFKKTLIVLIVFILAFTLIKELPLQNFLILNSFRDRLTFVDGRIKGDNRTDFSFDTEFNEFMRGDILKVLFGYGYGAAGNNSALNASASYKMLIYDYGIIGFIMILGWIIYATIKKTSLEKTSLILMIVFILSIYQRPNVLTVPCLLLLFGGYSNLKSNRILE